MLITEIRGCIFVWGPWEVWNVQKEMGGKAQEGTVAGLLGVSQSLTKG